MPFMLFQFLTVRLKGQWEGLLCESKMMFQFLTVRLKGDFGYAFWHFVFVSIPHGSIKRKSLNVKGV